MPRRPETQEEMEMFEYYWSLGDKRSLVDVAEHFNRSYDSLKRVSSRLRWGNQLVRRTEKIQEEVNMRLAESFARNRLKYYELMHERVIKTCDKVTLTSMRDWVSFFEAVKLLKSIGFNGEGDEVQKLPNFNIVLNRGQELSIHTQNLPE